MFMYYVFYLSGCKSTQIALQMSCKSWVSEKKNVILQAKQ